MIKYPIAFYTFSYLYVVSNSMQFGFDLGSSCKTIHNQKISQNKKAGRSSFSSRADFRPLTPFCSTFRLSLHSPFPFLRFVHCGQCDQIGLFFNGLGYNFFTKIAKYLVTVWAITECHYFSLECCGYILVNF